MIDKFINIFVGILAAIGFFTIVVKISNKIILAAESEPKNKEKAWKQDYQYVGKDYFMEHYRWCDYGKHWFDGEEDYQCICYAR